MYISTVRKKIDINEKFRLRFSNRIFFFSSACRSAQSIRARCAALILGFFTLIASFFFHNFWGVPAEAAMMQQLLFWKNIAVVGGLLGYAAHGAGAWSMDGRKA